MKDRDNLLSLQQHKNRFTHWWKFESFSKAFQPLMKCLFLTLSWRGTSPEPSGNLHKTQNLLLCIGGFSALSWVCTKGTELTSMSKWRHISTFALARLRRFARTIDALRDVVVGGRSDRKMFSIRPSARGGWPKGRPPFAWDPGSGPGWREKERVLLGGAPFFIFY